LTKPLPGLTADQLAECIEGLEEFEEVETVAEGLGPVFNRKSCAECHAVPRVAGSEPNVGVARETRIGGPKGEPLEDVGGPLLQQRDISLPGCNLVGTVRTTTCRGKEVNPLTRHPPQTLAFIDRTGRAWGAAPATQRPCSTRSVGTPEAKPTHDACAGGSP
jgi:hypothetical protein